MPSRYARLRSAIANLAAPADAQHAYLEHILAPVAPASGARGNGNDELALELEDIYCARGDMLAQGEISVAQAEAPAALDAYLLKWSGETNADFWVRDALWTDPRWDEVRRLARDSLAAFPAEPDA